MSRRAARPRPRSAGGPPASRLGDSCRLGGWLAGASDREVDALTEYGERVGVAFQLGDDLLDITTETAIAGKEPGTDLRAGVRTLPVLYLLRHGGPQATRLTELLEGERDDDDVAEALALLRCSPALAEARRTAEAEVDRGRPRSTAPKPPSPASPRAPAASPSKPSPTRSSTARSDRYAPGV